MGASAAKIYNLNIRPYTVKIMTNDSTVINRLPSNVTIHSGIESQKPTEFILSMTSCGSDVPPEPVNPDCPMMVETIPLHNREDGQHQVEAVPHGGFCQHEPEKQLKCVLRFFQFRKTRARFYHSGRKEQDEQSIADGFQRAVDIHHHVARSRRP